jgi:mono/diheme cytochrome c family protein
VKAPGQMREDAELTRSLRVWMSSGSVLFLLLVLAFPLYLLVDSTRRTEALADRESALIRSGGQLWGLNCASCHGTTGEGEDAPALNSQQFLEITSDEQMHRIIAAGITGAKMPAWWNEFGGPLTDEQITAIVAYVRSWEPSAPDRPDWRSAFEGGGG